MDKQEFHHETIRKKLWADAWVRTAGADNCIDINTPTKWADAALKEFDQRFPKPATK
jgi:hypothetical protein